MSTEALLRDPGFQLNLLLWMTREQPSNAYVVRPLFHEIGFVLVYIENPFPLPEETARTAGKSGLDIVLTPEPDVLLRRDSDQRGLYIEAKADSFSASSSSARQARGHLLAAGPAFAEVMNPLEECMLCYVIPDDGRAQMDTSLSILSNELRSVGMIPGPHSIHGLKLDGTDVLYTWDSRFSAHADVDGESAVVLRNVTHDTDPSPLFLVFSDEDYPDPKRQDLNRRAFQNQIYASLLCELMLTPLESIYLRTIDELLIKTTDGVFEYIGRERQKRMRRLIRENIFKRIVSFWRDREPGLANLRDDSLTIQYASGTQRDAFLDWLEECKRTDISTDAPPPEEPLPLLTMMESTEGTQAPDAR